MPALPAKVNKGFKIGLKERASLLFGKGDALMRLITRAVNLDPNFFFSGVSSGNLTAADIDKKPYKFHPWIFACCYTIVKNVSRLPLVLTRMRDQKETIVDHPVLTLLRRPNTFMTKTTLLQSIILNVLLPAGPAFGTKSEGGQSFMVGIEGDDADPRNSTDFAAGKIPDVLLNYNDSFISPWTEKGKGPGGMDRAHGWKLKFRGREVAKYLFQEVIRVHQFDPYNNLKGITNYDPVQVAILQDIKADIFNSRMYERQGVPVGIIKPKPGMTLTKEQREQIIEAWYEETGGMNSQGVIVFPIDGEYQQVAVRPSDMQYSEQKKDGLDKTIMVHNLNKIALGMYEDVNFATLREGRRMLWEDAYFPIGELVLDAMNSQWIEFIDPRDPLLLKFDTSMVRALRPDFERPIKGAAMMVKEMDWAPAKAAELNGIPISENDLKEMPWLVEEPWARKAELMAEAGLQPQNPEPPRSESEVRNALRRIVHRKHQKTDQEKFWNEYVERVLDPGEKKYESKIVQFFNQQRNRFLDNIDEWQKEQQKKVSPETKDNPDLGWDFEWNDISLDKKIENQKLIKMATPLIEDQMKAETAKLEEELGQLVEWNVTDARVHAQVRERSKFLRGINSTSFKKVRKVVEEAVDEAVDQNLTVQQVTKKIKKAVNAAYDTRKGIANLIARTETAAVSNRTRFKVFRVEGFEFHSWITAGDEKVRDEQGFDHVTAGLDSNNPVKIGDPFVGVSGMIHPLDPNGGKKNVINCRCVTVAVLESEGKYYVFYYGLPEELEVAS